jgi:D-inositol-3-phosphate glycosyltransferase
MTLNMKIAIISYHTCPLATLGGKDTGGMNVYVRDLTTYLGQHGVHADVFTRSQDEHVPHILHDLGHGNRVVHIPAGPENPRPKQELQDYIKEFSNNILAFAQEKEIQYDLIFSHYWLSGLAALRLKKAWNVPMAHMFHTLAHLKNKIAASEEEKDGQYRIDGELKVLKGADKIIVATRDEKENLLSLYSAKEKKIKVIPPGVDTAHFYPIPVEEAKEYISMPEDEKMILFVGRIEPLKGIDTLIRAIAQIRKADVLSICPHYLYIIGGNPEASGEDASKEMQRLQDLCAKLDLHDLVLFLGKRDQDSLQYYYSAAEMVVMPSHYESFGMVALEAMACGTPVIATQVGGLQHLVQDGETGFVIPNGDPDALEEKITMLICQEAMKDRMSSNSVAYAQTLNWDVIAEKLIKQFKKLTDR